MKDTKRIEGLNNHQTEGGSAIQYQLANYQLLTEKEVAARLNISVSKLQKDRVKGTGLEFVTLGKSIRYRTDTLIKYLEKNTYSSTSQISRGAE